MLSFNQDKKILKNDSTDFLFDLVNGKVSRDYDTDLIINDCFEKLKKKGFQI
jgi:hypothetical protein